MKFVLFSAAFLATISQAAHLKNHGHSYDDSSLAQVNAFVASEANNENLVEALSKVMASLSTDPPAAAPGAVPAGGAPAPAAGAPAAPPAPTAEVVKVGDVKRPAGKKNPEAGTNIAITTAMDQHINIFVPEDPDGKVTVKKTEGVKIVESDSDKADKNADVKKAIGDKIKGKLVKKAMRDSDSDESAGSDGGKKKIKKAADDIKRAKAKSGKMKSALDAAAKHTKDKHHHQHAQTGAVAMTEEEILALSQVQAYDYEDGFMMNDDALAQNESDSDSMDMELAELDARYSDSDDYGLAQVDSEVTTGLDEADIMALAQTEATNPTVKLTPQVHV